MENLNNFSEFIEKKNSQERPLKEMLDMKNDRCLGANIRRGKHSPNENSVYEKFSKFPLRSPLTIFFLGARQKCGFKL